MLKHWPFWSANFRERIFRMSYTVCFPVRTLPIWLPLLPVNEFGECVSVFNMRTNKYLYVTPLDEVSERPYLVRYNIPQINEEFAETCKLLWQHAQMNLLDVAIDEAGILTPSFIVLEPDYLIDISSLAECFRDYGHHPGNYFLSRMATG